MRVPRRQGLAPCSKIAAAGRDVLEHADFAHTVPACRSAGTGLPRRAPVSELQPMSSVGANGILVDSSPKPRSQFGTAWGAIVALFALVAASLLFGQGGVLMWLYPILTLAVGTFLFARAPTLYLGFVWWLWFLTPMVRRVVDWQTTWHPINPVMLAPYLVAGLACVTVVRHGSKLATREGLPFTLIFAAISYAYVVGTLWVGLGPASYAALTWGVPVAFAFHLVRHWENYEGNHQAVASAFVWGILVMGLYGIWQYFDPPVWDRYWIENCGMNSIGQPAPLKVRVFSTMNAPGPFAMVLMAGLVILAGIRGWSRWAAAGPGYAAFWMSLVRSAWGGWLVGLVWIGLLAGSPARWRLLATAAVMVALSAPLLTVKLSWIELLPDGDGLREDWSSVVSVGPDLPGASPGPTSSERPAATTVQKRVTSSLDLGSDSSLRGRIRFYRQFFPTAFGNVRGEGLGATRMATRLSYGGQLGGYAHFDSGVMEIPFVLGWPGAFLYVAGLAWLVGRAMKGTWMRPDRAVLVYGAAATGLLAQMIFVNTLVGPEGMAFWCCLAMVLAAQRWHAATACRQNEGSARYEGHSRQPQHPPQR